ncbi:MULTISPECIES: histidine--tRNA ligase [Ruminococcus]|uniref:Histidine--tRNA ligase n=1 Tax=Ruminococcus albus 8 TaxID=246199 RepID=E9SGN5_RUMAL|nr:MULTISPECIES: histidine--tRNA ligase [Ruminococcus]EGC01533.1 histidine--tRNA ligase [Ruminococcus albus 8]MBR0528515.1 histidine--tRNA ligase [Ruminococcus sp.]MCC3350320.1 histidine--tRNA ligase [Ruminococcus albus 8]
MAMIQRPKGTADMLPAQAYKWHTVEKLAAETAEQYGFKEIRVPTFEDTGLFIRSVGETTDVVQKEMFTVSATGDDTFTLRPEGTAGVMRAVVENGLLNEAFPQKLYYITSCFRHENVQKGRLREFHQFGCEMVGSPDAKADADVISLAKSVMDRVGLQNIKLNINSIGCPTCRANYQKALREYFTPHRDTLCDTCKDRLEKNPMRLLDCKSPICQGIAKDAPLIIDYLCEECDAHFKALQKYLSLMNIDFDINPRIVRGLDYYTRTVFEFIAEGIGAQSTVCGGGRYDGLLNELSGKQVPALGFGMGLERLIMTMEQQNCDFMEAKTCDLYIASMGQAAADRAMSLAMELRDEGYFVEYDLMGRGIKPQMKYADKIGSKFVIVIGDSELESGCAKLKNMASGEQTDIKLDNTFVENFSNALVSEMFKGVEEEMAGLLGKE